MPFTPAHPAIVLPFLRMKAERVSATALVIGSMAPDFEYFFKMSVSGQHGHTLWGILYFDIPVTIGLAFLFHLIVKKNLVTNLPVFLQRRLQDLYQLDFVMHFRRYRWAVIISAAIGSFSHIFWDAFTHNDGFFAQRISYYKHVVVPFDGVRYPLFYALQHISTWIGLTLVATWLIFMKSDKDVQASRPSFRYWALVIFISCCIVLLRFIPDQASIDLGNFVVSSISAALLAVVLCGFIPFKKRAIT